MGGLWYVADVGEVNDLSLEHVLVDGTAVYRLHDPGATIVAGNGCQAVDEHTVECGTHQAVLTDPVDDLQVETLDRNDVVALSAADLAEFHSPWVDTGAGDDEISIAPSDEVDQPMVLFGGEGDDYMQGGSGNDLLHGEAGSDTLVGGEAREELSGPQSLDGGGGDDLLIGGPDRDLLMGEGGSDTMRGGGRGDLLHPGGGDDDLHGGKGQDNAVYRAAEAPVTVTLDGVANDGLPGDHANVRPDVERVVGGSDGDLLIGSPDHDVLKGGLGKDTLRGLGRADYLAGEEQSDTLAGGQGADELWGADGEDALRGGRGADLLLGSIGADRLGGGAGNDRITGGLGRDDAFGGRGDDTLFMRDGERDLVDGGVGFDRARLDRRRGPTRRPDDYRLIESFRVP